MRKLAIATFAVSAVLSSITAMTANAAAPGDGRRCGFVSNTDPTGQANTQTGVIFGGPLTIPGSGHITCTIQVGSANSTHAGADAVAVSGPDSAAVVVLPPSQITYSATVDDNVYLCTSAVVDGVTYYYDSPADPAATGTWSTSSATNCALAISASTPSGDECTNDPVCSTIDLIVCTVTKALAPGIPGVIDIAPDGDVTLLGTVAFWDCPPYAA